MKQKSENLRKYKVFENMGKEMSEEVSTQRGIRFRPMGKAQ